MGRFFGAVMAHLNHEMNLFTLEHLDVRPREKVLEIGFGPGRLIAALCERARHGSVCGADHSDTMVRQAMARNREAVRAGRVALFLAQVSRLPFKDACFDRVCAVNSFQFWPAPEEDLREVRRVLKPGGLLALALRRGAGTSALGMGHLAEPSRVDDALRALAAADFRDLRVESRRLRYVTASCVLARG
ncbi:MAG TPA: class I SAM-dependent methyltransferase [Myxococcota bacterium]|nr:class I SAM-dependent methyltransferase [Myxococcota bacterium]